MFLLNRKELLLDYRAEKKRFGGDDSRIKRLPGSLRTSSPREVPPNLRTAGAVRRSPALLPMPWFSHNPPRALTPVGKDEEAKTFRKKETSSMES